MGETGDERTGTTAPGRQRDPFLVPRLNTEQLALLRRYGQERPTTAGQVLFREGDRGYDFIVVLSGAVTVVDHEAGVVRELVTEGPRSPRSSDTPVIHSARDSTRPYRRRARRDAVLSATRSPPGIGSSCCQRG